jgi:anti-sigma factor RsiW
LKARSDHEQRFVDYLLGVLPPEQQEELEERYVSNDDLHTELEAVADGLIHDYLEGRLSREESTRLEAHFLASPKQRQRLEIMRAVLNAARR